MSKATLKQRRFAAEIGLELSEQQSQSEASRLITDFLKQRRALRNSHPALSNELASKANVPPLPPSLGRTGNLIRSKNLGKGDIVRYSDMYIGVYLGQILTNPRFAYVFVLQDQTARQCHIEYLELLYRHPDNEFIHKAAAFEMPQKAPRSRSQHIREFIEFANKHICLANVQVTEHGEYWRKSAVAKAQEEFSLWQAQKSLPRKNPSIDEKPTRYCFFCGKILPILATKSYCTNHASLKIGKDRKRFCTICGVPYTTEQRLHPSEQRYCPEHRPEITDQAKLENKSKRHLISIKSLKERICNYDKRCDVLELEIASLQEEHEEELALLFESEDPLSDKERAPVEKRCACLLESVQNKQATITDYKSRCERMRSEIGELEARIQTT